MSCRDSIWLTLRRLSKILSRIWRLSNRLSKVKVAQRKCYKEAGSCDASVHTFPAEMTLHFENWLTTAMKSTQIHWTFHKANLQDMTTPGSAHNISRNSPAISWAWVGWGRLCLESTTNIVQFQPSPGVLNREILVPGRHITHEHQIATWVQLHDIRHSFLYF